MQSPDMSAVVPRGREAAAVEEASAESAVCFHCGLPCGNATVTAGDKAFCCAGCRLVFELLTENGLGRFYELNPHPGLQTSGAARREQWAFLDAPELQRQVLDFSDDKSSRVTFHVPAIHCVACVWLLENLFRLHPGVGRSQVNFPRREVAITFAPDKMQLSELVALLASLGYEPALSLGSLEKPPTDPARQRQWLQVGVAGFAFGNIMLLSLPGYLGLDSLSGPFFRAVFGYLSLGLALPVLLYSASDYWRSALRSFRQRAITLDVPIALGLLALYGQSAFEILSGRGEGYLDSLTGLVFFLLCGRVFQQKTHERLAFDRDFKSFFPLSVVRRTEAGEATVSLSDLRVGDRLVLRHRELIPADARLVRGPALIDYSFVTGESEPVAKQEGDYLYAGGQQMGGAIEVETVKPVSQSYLTSLWSHAAFQKPHEDDLHSLTNRYSRRFTVVVVGVALAAALGWSLAGDWPRGIKAFTSVLIVACPCALALAAPFTLGTAQRVLTRLQTFVRSALVIERMAQVDTIVFDKTGTLTAAGRAAVSFTGASATGEVRSPRSEVRGRATGGAVESAALHGLTTLESRWVAALARHSTHPYSVRLSEALAAGEPPLPVEDFSETPGRGIEGRVEGQALRLGSRAWLEQNGVQILAGTSATTDAGGRAEAGPGSSAVWLAINGQCRGCFELTNPLRPAADRLLAQLGARYELALLSGDHARERDRFRALFGAGAHLHFNQSPLDKLGFIEGLQRAGRTVMMVGDGLNDAGALKQSDVGVAVVEQMGAFSPASDVILEAARVPQLAKLLAIARRAAGVVRWSFAISAVYNAVGIGIASAGVLSPLICAVLMPLSSVSVVLFACSATRWAARRTGLLEAGTAGHV
jgi:Cu+-exporting ATPase